MPTNFQEWLSKVNQIQQGGQKPIEPGQPIPGFANPNVQLSPKSSSINLAEYKDYIGTPVLTGSPDEQLYLDDLRAQNQSGLAQARNAAGKFLVTAGTTFVDGLAGTAFGLANWASGDKGFSDFWNNPLSNAMTDIQEWSEKAMPNYRTAAELDAPFWKKLGTVNFWGDTVFKNLGFTVGALGAAALSGGVAGEGLLLKQGVKSLAKNSYGRIARQLGTNIDDVAKQIAEGTLDFSRLGSSLAKDAKQIRVLNAAQTTQGALMGAMAEARFEAINGARDYYETNKQKYIDLGMSEEEADFKASKESLGVGNTIFALNTALLTMSNAQQFKSLLNPGYQVESKAIKGLMFKDGKYAFEGMGKLGKSISAIKNPLMEGVEELSQTGIESFSKSYYERINDPETTNLINAYTGALGDSMSKMFSEEGLESFFVGMFTGAVGMPNIRKAIEDKSIKSAVTGWSGGIAEQLRSIKAEETKGTENVAKLNKILESDDFKNNYMNLSASLSAEAAKKRALRTGDEVAYEIADLQGFHSTVQQFIDSGKVNDLYQFLDNQSQKDATTLREEWSVENENKERVDPFKHLSDEEVVEYNRNRVKAQKDLAKRVAEVTNDIETKMPSIAPEVKKTLVEALVTTEFAENKAGEIKKKLVDEIAKFKGSKEFDGVTAESVVASAEAIRDIPKDIQEYLEKKFPINYGKWKQFAETKEKAVELYEYASDPERFTKKIEKQIEAQAKESFEKATTEDPKTGNKFYSLVDLRQKISSKGYGFTEDADVVVLDKDGNEIDKATIVSTNNGEIVKYASKKPDTKLEALVGENIRILPRTEKIQQKIQESKSEQIAILKKMSSDSRTHHIALTREINKAENEIVEFEKEKERIQEEFENAKKKRISKKKLQALIEEVETKIKDIDDKIEVLEKNIVKYSERASLIEDYNEAIKSEIENIEKGKDRGELSVTLEEQLKNVKTESLDFTKFTDVQEAIAASRDALTTLNEEIDVAKKEIEKLKKEKVGWEELLEEYLKFIPILESRDEVLRLFKEKNSTLILPPKYNYLAVEYFLGKVTNATLTEEVPDTELVERLKAFKTAFQKLKNIDVEQYKINVGEYAKAIQRHQELLDDKLKEKSYLETFKKLQNLELVRKGYEATALSSAARTALEEAEQDKTKVFAEQEPEKDVVDYQKDEVGANTYLHIEYGKGFKDTYDTFEFEGKTYTKPKLNENIYNKAYGEWMSELTNPSKYKLQLVTVNSATDEQQQAIAGINPSGKGEDSIYVFVVDKTTGQLVKHNGLLLVSTVLDSIKNDSGGDRFSAEAVESFLKNSGVNIKRTPTEKESKLTNEKNAPVLFIEINGERTEIVVDKFPSRQQALETYRNEIYSRFGQEYKKVKKALYEAVNDSPEFREINNISNGFSLRVQEDAEFPLSKIFKKEDLKGAKVRIAKQNEKYPAGTILVDFNGREASFKRRKLKETEVDFLFNVFKFHGDKSRGNVKIGSYDLFPPAYAKGENTAKFSAISNLINYGMNRDSASKKINRDKDQIFFTEKNTLVIITKTNLDTGEVMDNFQSYDFPFESIGENEAKIKTYLRNKRRHVNDAHLSANKSAIDFSIDKQGNVTAKASKKSYQQELLDNVLVTNIIPHTVGPQFAQRYFSFDFKRNDTEDSWDNLPTEQVPFEEEQNLKNDKLLKSDEFYRLKKKNTYSVKELQEQITAKGFALGSIAVMSFGKHRLQEFFQSTALPFSNNVYSALTSASDPLDNDVPIILVVDTSKLDNSLLFYKPDGRPAGINLKEAIKTANYEIFEVVKNLQELKQSYIESKKVSLEDVQSEKKKTAYKEVNDQSLLDEITEGQNTSVSNDSGLEATISKEPTVTDIPVLENPATDNDFGFESEPSFEDIFGKSAPPTTSMDRVVSAGKTLEELIKNNIIEKQCL